VKSLLLFIFATFCHQLEAENWNRFRGLNGNGQFPDISLPLAWKNSDQAWKIQLPGSGHSSPVIWEEKIFTTCASPNDSTQYVLCIDVETGSILWQKEFGSVPYPHHKFNSYASSSPAVDQDFLYVSWTTKKSNDLLCLDHNGKIIWKRDFGAYETEHGNGFSPIVYEAHVFVTHDHESDSALYALDRKTGKTIWKVDRTGSKPSASTPTIYKTKNGKALVVSNSQSHGCYAVDIESGKIAWETGPGSLDKRSVSSPYFARGYFFASCGSGSRGSRFLIVKPPTTLGGDAEIKHSITRNAPYVPTSLVIEDFVFSISDGGIACAIDLETGETLWRERVDGNFFASPVCCGNIIFLVSRDGKVITAKANRNGLNLLGESALNDVVHNTPAFSPRGIFFRTYGGLIHIPAKS
jgi:outer membrane protein assembly factor BamB